MVPQIFRGGQHHHHQGAFRQLLRHVVGTVQAVPFAFSIVAALVTVPVGEVVLAVLVIQGIALPFDLLTVKSVIQAAGIVALGITLPIIKVFPALKGL